MNREAQIRRAAHAPPRHPSRRPEPPGASRSAEIVADIRRAFVEFLALPTCVVAGFLVLMVAVSALDHAATAAPDAWFSTLRNILAQYVFGDRQTISDLLGTIAGGLFTVTSITFSMLLIAVQQAASLFTHQVFDQFLRRRMNQAFFGYFVGLTLFTLATLATVHQSFNPVYGAAVALLLTLAGLCLLVLLVYATVDQMRPAVILRAIHDEALRARARQRATLLRRTRRQPTLRGRAGTVCRPVQAPRSGFLAGINLDAMAQACRKAGGDVEIVFLVPLGSFLVWGDDFAEVHAGRTVDVEQLGAAVQAAVRLERLRDFAADPADGIEEIANIGWTSISTAKSNPGPGVLAVYTLRDLLARWSEPDHGAPTPDADPAPIVYPDDVLAELMDALESLAVVSSESMQYRPYAEVVRTFELLFDRLSADMQDRAEGLIRRILAALGDHVPTADLNAALSGLAERLEESGRDETAAALRKAQRTLMASVGTLASRATRTPSRGA